MIIVIGPILFSKQLFAIMKTKIKQPLNFLINYPPIPF